MESDLSFEISLMFSSYSNFYQLEESVLKLLAKKKIGLLVIHIRPQPFLSLTKPLIRGNNPLISLNPLIYNKNNYQHYANEIPPTFNKLVSKPLFMGINIFLGRLFLVNKIASKKILDMIINLESICNQNKIQLMILGVSPQPMTTQGNITCRKLDKYLITRCNELGINYIGTFEKMEDFKYYEKDNVHLSELGHIKLGETLFDGIKNVLQQKI